MIINDFLCTVSIFFLLYLFSLYCIYFLFIVFIFFVLYLFVLYLSWQENCSGLEVLDVSNCRFSGDDGEDHVRIDVQKFQTHCPLLRVLRLGNSKFRLKVMNSKTIFSFKISDILTTWYVLMNWEKHIQCRCIILMYITYCIFMLTENKWFSAWIWKASGTEFRMFGFQQEWWY